MEIVRNLNIMGFVDLGSFLMERAIFGMLW
jgi:hypothetical protein